MSHSVVSHSKVFFYDIKPGRDFVQPRSQSISLPDEGRKVDIEADKTLKITLKLSDTFAPTLPFKS